MRDPGLHGFHPAPAAPASARLADPQRKAASRHSAISAQYLAAINAAIQEVLRWQIVFAKPVSLPFPHRPSPGDLDRHCADPQAPFRTESTHHKNIGSERTLLARVLLLLYRVLFPESLTNPCCALRWLEPDILY